MDAETAADYSEAYARDAEAPAHRQRLEALEALLRHTLRDRVRT